MATWHLPGDAFVARRLREVVGVGERVAATAGSVTIVATRFGIARVVLDPATADVRFDAALRDLAEIVERCRTGRDPAAGALPLDVEGSPVELATWAALRAVRPGAATTCAELSRLVGARAAEVRRAVRANPVPVLVPCHRVTDAFGGEPSRLLRAEAAFA